jgi:hypothetical protein
MEIRDSGCRIVNTTEEETRATLRPLLEYAKTLRIVDPYMSTNIWSLKSLEIASELLGCGLFNRNFLCSIEFFVADGKFSYSENLNRDPKNRIARKQLNDSRILRDIWSPIFSKLHNQYGHIYKTTVFGQDQKKRELHDRFILTDQCGIQLSAGFTCDDPPHSQVWMIFPEGSYKLMTDTFVFRKPYPIIAQYQYPTR